MANFFAQYPAPVASGGGGGGGTVTSVDVSGGVTGLTTSGGPITTSGTITVGGTLNVAHGGTNSTIALNNNRVMQSSGGAIVEAAAITVSRALASDANGIPVASATTATELGYVNGVTSSIQTQLNAKMSSTLTDAHIFVGNNTNVATDVAVSGDLTLADTGAFTIASGAVTNAKIAAAAGISVNKLAALTASRAVASDGSGFLTSSATTATELGYVNGVTSSIQTQLNNKMGEVLPTNIQEVFVNLLSGSNVTGVGSYDKPYQTIAFACTQITDSSSNKPYAIRLCGARQNETQDILLPPYVSIHGPGQRACIIRGVGTNAIKPSAAQATNNSWNILKDVYISSTLPVNWDLQALGGSNCLLLFEDVTIAGTFTYKGRNGGAGDFLEGYASLMFGTVTIDSVSSQLQNIDFINALTLTDTQATGASATILNCSIDTSLTVGVNCTLSNVAYPGGTTFTTTAAKTITSYRGLPPVTLRTLFAGTTITNSDNATIVPYTPAVPGNWAIPPVQVSEALDDLAAKTSAGRNLTAQWITADGASKTVTHNWGTRNIMVQIIDNGSSYATIDLAVTRPTTNTVVLTASEAPASAWTIMLVEVLN